MLHRVKKKNDLHQGKWNGLGGKFEDGETPEDCVVREVREESGLRIKDPDLRAILTFPRFDGRNDWLVFLFVAVKFTGEIIESDEGDLHWIDDKKIASLNLWEGDKLFLKWLDRKKFFSAKFLYEKGILKTHHVRFYPIDF